MDSNHLLDNSKLLIIDSSQSFHYTVQAGKPIKLGLVIDRPTRDINLSLSVEAVDPDSACQVKILSILNRQSLRVSARLVVKKGAVGTNFHLNHQTVLLDKSGNVETKPELVIQQDEVKCGHGATVSVIDRTTTLYLESRGIGRQKAESMLCSSYIQSLCDWVLTKSDVAPSLGQ